MWYPRVRENVAEASFCEAWFAATYGLPTACFHSNGRALAMDDQWLQRLYDGSTHRLGSGGRLDDLQLHPVSPITAHRTARGARRST